MLNIVPASDEIPDTADPAAVIPAATPAALRFTSTVWISESY